MSDDEHSDNERSGDEHSGDEHSGDEHSGDEHSGSDREDINHGEVPEDTWDLIKQLRVDNLINVIEETVFNDFEHLADMVKGRELNLETFTLLVSEAVQTRSGKAMLVTTGLVVCIVLFVYPMAVASPFLASIGFTDAGPAAGSVAAAAQSAYGVNAMFSTLQSAAMGGYGVPAVAGAVQGAAAAGAGFAAHNLWGIISENKDD